ncbi:MAG: GspE/PulE family protein [Candidatus Omnitrophica bacterium]|nr:GspE/PulE family protein [Candidatus Omnitrophota bacterium]
MSTGKHVLLGELLISKKLIRREQLEEALADAKRSNRMLGTVLLQKGMVKEKDMVLVLSEQLNIPFFDLEKYKIDLDCINLISKKDALRWKLLPVKREDGNLIVAMIDPMDLDVVDELEQRTELNIIPMFTTMSNFRDAVQRIYSVVGHDGQRLQGVTHPEETEEDDLPQITQMAGQSEIIKTVQKIFEEAVRVNASDVHVEPQEKDFYYRFRIDGVLQKQYPLEKTDQAAIISRIKIMADINIAQKRIPQDGRIQLRVDKKDIDLRVATFPTIYGEHIAIRVLDKSVGILSFEQLGIIGLSFFNLSNIIHKPYGIILVTGPTGSGKTTTLYSILNEISSKKKNIITLEDPVEYSIPGIHQAQINVKAGLTFSTGLRSIVRLDPDIIMIGEIRDKETAEISIHAALTGHLVFSTLHTNDAVSAVSRLIDIGVEPYLLSSALTGVIAQRLVRRLCPDCREAYDASWEELEVINKEMAHEKNLEKATLYRPVGCANCFQVGYKGRIGIYEILIPDEQIKELINQKATNQSISNTACKANMILLKQDGIEKALEGITTLTQVLGTIG